MKYETGRAELQAAVKCRVEAGGGDDWPRRLEERLEAARSRYAEAASDMAIASMRSVALGGDCINGDRAEC